MIKNIIVLFIVVGVQCFFATAAKAQQNKLDAYLNALLKICECDTTGVDPVAIDPGIQAHFQGGDSALWVYIKGNLKIPVAPAFKNKVSAINVGFRLDTAGKVKSITPDWETPEWAGLETAIADMLRKMPNWIPNSSSDRKIKYEEFVVISFYVYNNRFSILYKKRIWK